ncbi:F-box protein-like protein [Drosera capensis]
MAGSTPTFSAVFIILTPFFLTAIRGRSISKRKKKTLHRSMKRSHDNNTTNDSMEVHMGACVMNDLPVEYTNDLKEVPMRSCAMNDLPIDSANDSKEVNMDAGEMSDLPVDSTNDSEEVHMGACKINDLPFDVITSILSYLPTEEAIRTAVLCKTWRNKWKDVSRLDFSSEALKDKPEKRSLLINSVLDSHNAVTDSFRLKHKIKDLENGSAARWVQVLLELRGGVKELSLSFQKDSWKDRWTYAIRIDKWGTFSGRSLRALELQNYAIKKGDWPFKGCENLKRLKLDSVLISSSTMTDVMDYHKLEELSLLNISLSGGLSIADRWLKSLELICVDASLIYIEVYGLHSLYLDNIRCPLDLIFIKSPNLHNFTVIDSSPCPKGFSPLTTEQILRCCCTIVPVQEKTLEWIDLPIETIHDGFVNIRVLSTHLDLTSSQDATLLAYILRVCRNIKVLNITNKGEKGENEPANYLSYPKDEMWAKKEVFDCITFTLKKVRIRGFKGTILELEFVKYVLKYATNLQELVSMRGLLLRNVRYPVVER